MPFAQITVDDKAFEDAFEAAMDGYRELAQEFAVFTADKVVEVAKRLAPESHDPRDPPGRLRDSIHHDPPERVGLVSVSVKVIAGGPGIRETLFMEYGTYKDRAQPYMRPALAAAAGGLRGIGVAARLSYSGSARNLLRTAKARAIVRRARRRKTNPVQLTGAEARAVSTVISNRVRTMPARRRRRARRRG